MQICKATDAARAELNEARREKVGWERLYEAWGIGTCVSLDLVDRSYPDGWRPSGPH
jgi:hypothetical protein